MRGLVMELNLDTTQQRVFDYIVENGSITSLEAIEHFGETRISARIFELKKKGCSNRNRMAKRYKPLRRKKTRQKVFFWLRKQNEQND